MYVYIDVELDADSRDAYLAALAREGKDAWDRAVEWRAQELWNDVRLKESSVPGYFDLTGNSTQKLWEDEMIRAVSRRSPLFGKGDPHV